MHTDSLVSVVIPAYNSERFVAEAAASVLGQSYRDLELVIVDDGSTDGTRQVAERVAAGDPRARVVHKENGGLSSARNAGIAVARGEFLCFLDADDMYLPDKLERQVAFLKLFPSCDLAYSDYYSGDGSLTPFLFECRRPPPLAMGDLLAYRNWFQVASSLLRARVVDKVGGFDETLKAAEDWDFWIRASKHVKFAYLPGPVMVYRCHPAQMHNDRERMRSNQDLVIRKHFPARSKEWHVTRAARAWTDAKWHADHGRYARMVVSLGELLWHARSRQRLRNVVKLVAPQAT